MLLISEIVNKAGFKTKIEPKSYPGASNLNSLISREIEKTFGIQVLLLLLPVTVMEKLKQN